MNIKNLLQTIMFFEFGKNQRFLKTGYIVEIRKPQFVFSKSIHFIRKDVMHYEKNENG